MSPSLKELVQNAHRGNDLVVTGPHYEWQDLGENGQVPSMEAIAHVVKVLLGHFKHPRKGRFSPSSMGGCARAIVFGYAGAPQEVSDPELDEMASHGTFGHLRWQVEGLTMGYMTAAEVWVEDKDLLIGGSMDGELHDSSIFELKTKAPGPYTRITADAQDPPFPVQMQVHTYFLLSGADWASVVYENRAYGSFYEFRVARDAKIEREVIRRLNAYRRHVEDNVLPPMLGDCEYKIGTTYHGCPYRKICPTMSKVSEAEALHRPEDELVLDIPEWAVDLLNRITQAEQA